MIVNASDIVYASIHETILHENFRYQDDVHYKSSQFNFMLGRIGKLKRAARVVTFQMVYDDYASYKVWNVVVDEDDFEKHRIYIRDKKVYHWPTMKVASKSGYVFTLTRHPDQVDELHELQHMLLSMEVNIDIGEAEVALAKKENSTTS